MAVYLLLKLKANKLEAIMYEPSKTFSVDSRM